MKAFGLIILNLYIIKSIVEVIGKAKMAVVLNRAVRGLDFVLICHKLKAEDEWGDISIIVI